MRASNDPLPSHYDTGRNKDGSYSVLRDRPAVVVTVPDFEAFGARRGASPEEVGPLLPAPIRSSSGLDASKPITPNEKGCNYIYSGRKLIQP